MNENIRDLNRMLKEKKEVQVEPGEQCTCPYECWYYGYCHWQCEPAEQMNMEELS